MSAEEPQVAWTAIEAGARVIGSDGGELGKVEEIVGDAEADIFTGLSIEVDGHDTPRFVDADAVTAIWPSRVSVAVPASAADSLPEHRETPETAWDPVEEKEEANEGLIESVLGDVSEPGDQLEIGRSPLRAGLWAVAWGVIVGGLLAILPGVSLAGGVYAGLFVAALVLVSGQVWPPAADLVIGAAFGLAAAVYLLVDGQDALVSIAAGLLILAGAYLLGLVMRGLIAERFRR
jgi:hypothetical protein